MGMKQKAAVATLAGAALLGGGLAATGTATAQAPAQQVTAKAFHCPYKTICVHGYSWKNGHKKYSWRTYWTCSTSGRWKNWYPTYFVNNQTHGQKAWFLNTHKHNIQTVPGAYSKGKVKHPTTTFYLNPC